MSSGPDSTAQTASPTQTLADWFAVEPGRAVAEAELALAAEVLSNLFGYHILQLGDPYPAPLIAGSRIQHQAVLASAGPHATVRCHDEALPVQAGSVDVVVLPHVLEFARSPHAVLREVERVLIPEGHVVVLAFNPWSCFGLWRIASAWRGQLPWRGRFVGLPRLRDWLTLLGLEVERIERCSFRPPLRQGRLFTRLEFLERLGQHFWPLFGNVYCVLARKRVLALRPIRARWARQRRLQAAGVIEPSTRGTSASE